MSVHNQIKSGNSPSRRGGLPYGLGREVSPDSRDKQFLISAAIPRNAPLERVSRYWNASQWWGNQGRTPHCVGYSWAHWLEDGPVTQKGPGPIVHPDLIYREAQLIDEWAGENYDGTSVRAGAKYLMHRGFIQEYRWGYTVQDLIQAVMNVGPAVVGTWWYEDMFFPDSTARIRIGGYAAGGHAYVINGYNTNTGVFRLKNSWGRDWGRQGHAYISVDDMARLIDEYGEVCLAVEKKA